MDDKKAFAVRLDVICDGCGLVLDRRGGTLGCENSRCPERGKRYAEPVVELEPK